MKWWHWLILELLIIFGVMAWIYFFPSEIEEDFAKGLIGFVLFYAIENCKDINRKEKIKTNIKEFSMVKKAKKKPVVIEFIQFNGNTNRDEICKWIGKDLKTEVFSDSAYEAGMGAPYFSIFIPTLEGEMRADPYDYIIKGVNGEFYPCKPDIFEKTYDVIEE